MENDDQLFVVGLLRFARGVTLANGCLGAIATVLSFVNSQAMTGFFYLTGTCILLLASMLLTRKLGKLREAS